MGLFSLFNKSDVAFIPDCTLYVKYNSNFVTYQKILSTLGITHRVFEQNVCSGIEFYESGYDTEARKIARENLELFKKEKIKKIITFSPPAMKMFSHYYSPLIPEWNIEVKNVWAMIAEILENKKYLMENKVSEVITFHDSCYLGRQCRIFDEPRKILNLIGYTIKEMDNSREQSFCCGSCGGLPRVDPALADKLARERILQAKRIGVKKIIVSCFDNYDLLSKNIGNTGVEIMELSQVLAQALGIQVSKNEAQEDFSRIEQNSLNEAKKIIEPQADLQ